MSHECPICNDPKPTRPDPGKRSIPQEEGLIRIVIRESHLWGFCLFVIGFMLSLLMSVTTFFYNTPAISCSQEDSCYADYYNHQWHITRAPSTELR